MSICDLFNDKKVEEELKTRLSSLNVTNDILEVVYKSLDPKMVVEKTVNTIIIKIDRRKNKENIIEDLKEKISNVLTNPSDMDLLFKFQEVGNELIIRKRRMRY